MQKYHGLITQSDLDHYEAKVRAPLHGHFRGYEILSAPPPSAGGTMLIEMLNILDPLDLDMQNSYPAMHLIAETMRRAYADRASYLGDGDFAQVPVDQLTSLQHADFLRKQILDSPPEAPVTASHLQVEKSGATTHFSVVDAEGNAVSNTYTLDGWFGWGVTVEGAGFLLNNEMDDFSAKPGAPNLYGLLQSEANSIAPHKRPLSQMTPTIVLEDGKLRLVLGSPGGSTITNTVFQVLLNVLVYRMDVLAAVGCAALSRSVDARQGDARARGIFICYYRETARGRIPGRLSRKHGGLRGHRNRSSFGLAPGRIRSSRRWKGGWILMDYGLSTYLYANERLGSHVLDKILGAGFKTIEVFAARQHLDYTDRNQVRDVAQWFHDHQIKLHAVHAPLYSDAKWGSFGGIAVSVAYLERRLRIDSMDEIKRALEMADTSAVPLSDRPDGPAGRRLRHDASSTRP